MVFRWGLAKQLNVFGVKFSVLTILVLGLFLANPAPQDHLKEDPVNPDEIEIPKKGQHDEEKEQEDFEKLLYPSRATLGMHSLE